ncbi:helix-turn-helix domain-containing protein [Enterococcus casseliflavus]|uniref:helix-turn-helix domain-containing protein n=1 Tax=Enterococcus casseliflavus TaxID=37734 RepID=UPI0022DED1B3|nr:helix-turn-helix transcriptional regulator [Enterococcus casseliflavus]
MNRIKELREERKLSLATLSESLKNNGINISRASLNNYEREEQFPKQETWQALADFFHVDVQYIMGLSPTRNSVDKMFYENSLSRIVNLIESNTENVTAIRRSLATFSVLIETIKDDSELLNSFRSIMQILHSFNDIDSLTIDELGNDRDTRERLKYIIQAQEKMRTNIDSFIYKAIEIMPQNTTITLDLHDLLLPEEIEELRSEESFETFLKNEDKKEELRKKIEEQIKNNIDKIDKNGY